MKTTHLKLILAILLISTSALAQNSSNDIIYIKSPHFVSPLVEKWIVEYSKSNPQVQLKLADSKVKPEDIAVELVSSGGENNSLQNNVLYFGRYAILPIARKDNPLLSQLTKKRLNNKRIKDLFFEKNIIEDDDLSSQSDYNVIAYTGNNKASVAQTFSAHFGCNQSRLKGKKISGDDLFLVNAIQKDSTGVTFNTLGNIYDLNSRKLKKDIAILPLDIKKEYRQYFTESSNIDDILRFFENEKVDLIPIEYIGFKYTSKENGIRDFFAWILKEGHNLNHFYGIMNLEENDLAEQLSKNKDRLYTQNK
jgi:ABC-type phosphate transport system substrate-binding protein